MFWFKSCPRCLGDLYEGRDGYGSYVACAQCGHYLTEAEETMVRYGFKGPVELGSRELEGVAVESSLVLAGVGGPS